MFYKNGNFLFQHLPVLPAVPCGKNKIKYSTFAPDSSGFLTEIAETCHLIIERLFRTKSLGHIYSKMCCSRRQTMDLANFV